MSGYQYLPALDDDQRHALRQSIEANGILQPVEVDEDGNILDGHHRREIAQELGIDCPARVIEGLDETGKRKYAITVNLMRRQMTPTVRGALVAQLRTEGMSVRRIAAETGIPKTTVERDLSRVPHGTPDAIQGADGKSYAATKPPTGPSSPYSADRPGSGPTSSPDPEEVGPSAGERWGAGPTSSPTSSPVADYIAADPAVQTAEYMARFTTALARAGGWMQFDAERVAELASQTTWDAIEVHAAVVAHYFERARKARRTLRVLPGGAA